MNLDSPFPFAGWTFDVSNFRTGARNFFDHDVLGNSNIFFPLTIARARIRGWEATANSPRIANALSSIWPIPTSTRKAPAASPAASPISNRPTKAISSSTTISATRSRRASISRCPGASWADFNVNYGSGFLDGEGAGAFARAHNL